MCLVCLDCCAHVDWQNNLSYPVLLGPKLHRPTLRGQGNAYFSSVPVSLTLSGEAQGCHRRRRQFVSFVGSGLQFFKQHSPLLAGWWDKSPCGTCWVCPSKRTKGRVKGRPIALSAEIIIMQVLLNYS